MGVSVRTAYKWLARYRHKGRRGLENRSSRPHALTRSTKPNVSASLRPGTSGGFTVRSARRAGSEAAPSLAWCDVKDSTGWRRWSRHRRPDATGGRRPAIYYTWTSRSWGASTSPDIGPLTFARKAALQTQARITFMSPSTTKVAWPVRASNRMKPAPVLGER